MKISLLVIRCKDIERSKTFYEKLGLVFVKEKHSVGPCHYSCEYDGVVFELYPNKDEEVLDRTRLGFNVANIETVISRFSLFESYEFDGEVRYVLIDPDGRKVEVH